MNIFDELNRIAHDWEQSGNACDSVRYSDFGDDIERAALLNRSKVFNRCANQIRRAAEEFKESSQTAINTQKPKSARKTGGKV